MKSKAPLYNIAPRSRLHYMDNCRALLCLTVLIIHSGMAYATPNFFLWLFHDPAGKVWMNGFILTIHTITMPSFYLISGFFTRHLWYRKKDHYSFWKNRFLRIVLPFFVMLLLYVPFKFVFFLQEIVQQYTSLHHHLPPPMTIIKQSEALTPLLSHLTATNELWFLWYVLFFYLLIYPLSFLDKYIAPGWRSLIFIMPTILIIAVYQHPDTHVIAPRSLLVEPWVYVYFACFFALGWFAEKSPMIFHHFSRYLYPCCFFLVLGLIGLWILGAPFQYEPNALKNLFSFRLLHELITVNGVCLIFGILYRYGDKPNRLLRYLADCSYWCYLTSIYSIIAVQAFLYNVHWPIAIKLIVVVTTVQLICCATYELFVRHTFLSRFVGQKQHKKAAYTHTPKNPLSFHIV